ncbi:DUF4185 domain-containing protein [Allokutzneria oryzae]|uniref:DUF4185 domain-containing protein n=1 Tax=Allokutzneria oryzae TaxID=1378989 RepID=A0ABV5ZYL8_9PSEU
MGRFSLALGGIAGVIVSVGAPLAIVETASGGQPEEVCARPLFETATPNAALTGQFAAYGDDQKGRHWSGADSTYSVRLPDGRLVWMFSDTFLGPVNSDHSRSPGSPFIHNSFVVQQGDSLSTLYNSDAPDAPEALLRPPRSNPRTDWYWVGGGAVTGDVLTVLYTQWHLPPASDDPLGDVQWRKNIAARYSLPELRLLGTDDLPSAVDRVERGSWLLADGSYTYVYGVRDSTTKSLVLARVTGTDLRGRWEFRTATGWSADEHDSAPLLEGVSNEYSVTKHGDTYVLVTHDTSTPFANQIVAYTSCSPDGPFTGRTVLYQTPEGPLGTRYRSPASSHSSTTVWSYNAHVHPTLSSDRQLVISYNVNSTADADNYRDTTIYRPRFIDVPMTFNRAR